VNPSDGRASDGGLPNGGLIEDSAGNLYGATYQGGQYNSGVIYKVGLGIQQQAQVTLVDPVPQLLRSGAVIPVGDPNDNNILATQGGIVTGVAADGVSQLLIRVSGINAGDQVTITLKGDDLTGLTSDDGGLDIAGGTDFSSESVSVSAVSTSQGPMAFAVYRAPIDFPRPTKQQDKGSASRSVSIQVQPASGGTVTSVVTILRPPVVLIHGLWSSALDSWGAFCPLFIGCKNPDSRFSVSAVDYNYIVGYLDGAPIKANALGFQFNAPNVLGQLRGSIDRFKRGNNRLGIQAAAVQADVVAHSMGGDITRTFALQQGLGFYVNTNFDSGDVHKLITIDTPHLGTPVATQLLDNKNSCIAALMNDFHNSVISHVTINGQQVSGAVFDLSGDGYLGGTLSPALTALQQQGPHPLVAALIASEENAINLTGLDSCRGCLVFLAHHAPWCRSEPLTQLMYSQLWQGVFSSGGHQSPGDDALVPFVSQLNGSTSTSDQQMFLGLIHSPGTKDLGFLGPSVLDEGGLVPNEVIGILNTPITDMSVFGSINP
jgi:uncharacterized repeat protein (TIGR03803 family)